jgi:hypothetical protein
LLLSFAPAAQASFPGQNGKIAFFSGTTAGVGVHVIEPEGTGLALVVPSGVDPAWSANGSRLAYVVDEFILGGVYVANGDGSGQTRIRATSFSSDGFVSHQDRFREPAWHPDGGTIAYEAFDFPASRVPAASSSRWA